MARASKSRANHQASEGEGGCGRSFSKNAEASAAGRASADCSRIAAEETLALGRHQLKRCSGGGTGDFEATLVGAVPIKLKRGDEVRVALADRRCRLARREDAENLHRRRQLADDDERSRHGLGGSELAVALHAPEQLGERLLVGFKIGDDARIGWVER